jgi:hypothetical protein
MDWDVTTVKAMADFTLEVELADGRRGVFDLRPFLGRPGLQRLKDPACLSRVSIRMGALTWPHDEDVAPDTLAANLKVAAAA